MIQHLTVEDVKTAGLKAYKAHKLTAQHPDQSKRLCVYTSGSCHCIIGAALNESTLAEINRLDLNEQTSVDSLRGEEIITCDDIEALTNLQSLHDTWAMYSRDNGARHPTTIKSRDKLLEALK